MMMKNTNTLIWIILLVLALLVCCVFAFLGAGVMLATWDNREVGFDIRATEPHDLSGDMNAGSHIFIHNYPMPADGWMDGVRYRNDAEAVEPEIPEGIVLLVLRPESSGFRVIATVETPVDDALPQTRGVTTVKFPTPIRVAKGDLLAHYQPLGVTTGPIPLNVDGSSIYSLSMGKAGFTMDDIAPGSMIAPEGFTGLRDYYITAIFRR